MGTPGNAAQRELALFSLGIDSKLRGCDLVPLMVRNVCHGDLVAARAIVMQHKAQRPVRFEIAQATRDTLLGQDRAEFAAHSMRGTKAKLICRPAKNLRAVQLLLVHSKQESTVRCLGIEVDDALEISAIR